MAKKTGEWANKLYYGDNLDVLREHVPDESVDLIYLDPPFNSNRSYNVLFKEKTGEDSPAQIQAFDDTWTWSQETEMLYIAMMTGPASNRVKDALEAMRKLLGDNDVLAYLVMMTARLVELHRVLKPTGTIFLHCDPTASHYLKMILDAIFGIRNFRNEVIWKRSTAHSDTKQGSRQMGRIHDVVLFYSKGNTWTWNPIYTPYDEAYILSKYRFIEEGTGRRYRKGDLTAGKPGGDTSYEWKGVRPYKGRYWAYSRQKMEEFEAEGRLVYTSTGMPEFKRYLDEMPGVPLQDLWTDIDPINSKAAERLGYPTQKPLPLLERIVQSCSNEGDIVLDPFCGCGTTIDAAEKLKRRWIGIDITTLAIDLIDARLRHTYGEWITASYEIEGIPKDLSGARALFARSPFEFERWCVMMVDGQPNDRQVGDRGVDGVIRIPTDARGGSDRILVSVKGGATQPGHVRDLVGTVASERAAMGVFITMRAPTKAMMEAARHSGVYTYPVNGQKYPLVQIITVEELLAGKRPSMPATLLPYFQAVRRYDNAGNQTGLF
ncbi:DNA methyltransferase [Microbispora bryophytorum]|uniref:DNA methyltransferase n=1 Tax=Microbispora bryophytorum TaxID=1460882 RepID=UPI0033F49511